MSESSRLCRAFSWIRARFSFKGRASRTEFWLTFPLAFLCAGLGAILIAALGFLLSWAVARHHLASFPYVFVIILPLILLDIVLYFWLGLAASIRRTHDLGHSYRDAFKLRLNIQGGFKRGTIGPNEYGPDPLEKAASPE